MTIQDLVAEGWTAEELSILDRQDLVEIICEAGYNVPSSATKADLVALMMGEIDEIPMRPEDMIRTAMQYRSWVRGVPPPHACLTAADKWLLTNLWHALDPIWYLT